jgi:hypothetical protein
MPTPRRIEQSRGLHQGVYTLAPWQAEVEKPVSKCLQSGTCSGSARAASRCHPEGRRGRPRNPARAVVR